MQEDTDKPGHFAEKRRRRFLRRRRCGLGVNAASVLPAAAFAEVWEGGGGEEQERAGSAARVAPFTFFTQKPAKHTRAQTVLDPLTVGVCTVRKPKALTACSHETVPLA